MNRYDDASHAPDSTPRPSAAHAQHTTAAPPPAGPVGRRGGLGLPWLAIIGLALLGAPRVVLHDLHLIHEGTFVNLLLVVVPVIVWIVVTVAARVPHPFLTLLAIGAAYGVVLAVVHQVLWHVSFGGEPPALGGNLAGLPPAAQETIMRVFAAFSSLFTGVVIGAITGLIAWGIGSVTTRIRS